MGSSLSLVHHYFSLEPFWAPSACGRSSSLCTDAAWGILLGASCLVLHGAVAEWAVRVVGQGPKHFSHPSPCPPSGGQEDWLPADDQGSRRRWGQRHPKSGGSGGIWCLLPAGERCPEPPSPSYPGACSRVLLPCQVSPASRLGSPQVLPSSWDEFWGTVPEHNPLSHCRCRRRRPGPPSS